MFSQVFFIVATLLSTLTLTGAIATPFYPRAKPYGPYLDIPTP